MGYALAHKGKATATNNVYDPMDGPDAYTNASVYPKLAEYTSTARQRHGEMFNPATDPLDTDLVMRLEGGKQHGRY
jgi:F0F1-type ATP synthase beta subunit